MLGRRGRQGYKTDRGVPCFQRRSCRVRQKKAEALHFKVRNKLAGKKKTKRTHRCTKPQKDERDALNRYARWLPASKIEVQKTHVGVSEGARTSLG